MNLPRIEPVLRVCSVVVLLGLVGCASRGPRAPRIVHPERPADVVRVMEVTAYSDDKISTNWKRNIFGKPVVASGPNKGRKKVVGLTASGVMARKGSVAADPSWPFGTLVFVPGYGWGRVEDRGGAIKGNRLDVFFSTRKAALQWGRKQKEVLLWYPDNQRRR